MYEADSGEQSEVFETRTDHRVELIERASGEVLGETTIHGRRSGCGPLAFSTLQRSEVPQERADAWIAAELRRVQGG